MIPVRRANSVLEKASLPPSFLPSVTWIQANKKVLGTLKKEEDI